MIGEEEERIMSIKDVAYRKYQWHWLISHDYNIGNLDDIASDWFNERLSNPKDDGSLSDYILEHGFNGSIWACYDEFMDVEYQDAAYMKSLLSNKEYADYCKDTGIEPEVETVYVVQSEASYDCVRNFTIHGICKSKEKAREILKKAVKNSAYFDEAESPEIGEDYADTDNQDVAGADWEEITIEETNLI